MDEEPSRTDRRGRDGFAIIAASVASGLSGYGVLVSAARSLDSGAYATFLAFWGLMFFMYGLLGGIQSDVTRAAATATAGDGPAASKLPVIVTTLLAVGGIAAFALMATSPLWHAALLDEHGRVVALCAALGVVAFSGHVAVAGVLAGSGAWSSFSKLVAAEAVVRVALVGMVLAAGGGLVAVCLVTAAASLTWLTFLPFSPAARRSLHQRADRGLLGVLVGWGHVVVAAASTAILVVGFPVLVRLTFGPTDYQSASGVLLVVILTRAPILVPLGALQNVAVAAFARSPASAPRLLGRIVGGVLVTGIVLSALASFLGPAVLHVLRPGYEVARAIFGALTFSGALIGVLAMTGSYVLALDRHRWFAAGWTTAAALACGVLVGSPGGVAQRIATSLVVGPIGGCCVHLAGARAATRR